MTLQAQRVPERPRTGCSLTICAACTPDIKVATARPACTRPSVPRDAASVAGIERLMCRHGIHATSARRFRPGTTDSRHSLLGAPSLLGQRFTAAALNQAWLADITYVPTGEGWLYLAAVLDLASRKVVGWAMRDHLRTEPAAAALLMATQRQRPAPGLTHIVTAVASTPQASTAGSCALRACKLP